MSSGEMDAQQRPEQLCLTGKCPLPSQMQTVGAKPGRMLSNAAVTAHIGRALTGRTLLQGGVLVSFAFRGVSGSGSSNPRLLPMKTWHSATVEIHGLFYKAGIPAPAPLLHMSRNSTHSTGCGIPWPGCRGDTWHISSYLCQDMGCTNAWRASGQCCALFLRRILQADKGPLTLWASGL